MRSWMKDFDWSKDENGKWVASDKVTVTIETTVTIEVDEPKCESGWTNDRCTFPLGHEGDHSNE